jgi:glycosyltransferase involved in cell wall biosynthesis
MIRLSIIIPMYKVEVYVERCLRSLENQDISREDYEIICINDGSPDDCSGVVKRLQAEFSNIRLIEQENQGVSRARNLGMDSAYGKYMLFIDPDDYVEANRLSGILKASDDQDAQVSFLGFTILKKDGNIHHSLLNEKIKDLVFKGTVAYTVSRGDGRTDPDRMWAILFATKFMNENKLRFLPDVPYLEDGEFIARILCLAERCIFHSQSFYLRTTRPGSATNSGLFHSEKAINGFTLAASNLKNFQQKQNLNEIQRKFLNQPIAKFALLSVNSSLSRSFDGKLAKTIKVLRKSTFRKLEVKGCNFEYRICGTAFNLSPWLGAVTSVLYSIVDRRYQLIFKKKV